MKLMKRNMTALVALFMVSAGAWAQAEEVTVTPRATMPGRILGDSTFTISKKSV